MITTEKRKLGHDRVSRRRLENIRSSPENARLYRPVDPADPDVRALAESIRQHGVQMPIETHDGKILDGRNRYRACLLRGVEPDIIEAETDDPIGYVLSMNLHRRHLSVSQLALAADKAVELRQGLAKAAKERQKARKGKQAGASPENSPDLKVAGKAEKLRAKLAEAAKGRMKAGGKTAGRSRPQKGMENSSHPIAGTSRDQLGMAADKAVELRHKLVKAAKERQKRKPKSVPENSPDLKKADSRDEIGEAFGISGNSVDKGHRVRRDAIPAVTEAASHKKGWWRILHQPLPPKPATNWTERPMSTDIAITPLSEVELTQLQECESVIDRGRKTFVEVGRALLAIREGDLHRQTHGTFEEYCKDRWDIERAHGYRLMASAGIVDKLSPMGDRIPSSERQARPLTTVPMDQVGDVWDEVVERAPRDDDDEPVITAKHVKEVVDWWKSEGDGYEEDDKDATDGTVFLVELRALKDETDPAGRRRLRTALKVLLRRFGLRCVRCEESGNPAADLPRP